MAELFFLLAGIVLLFKKEVHVSRKRTITGKKVKILAVLYVAPFISGIVSGAIQLNMAYASWVSISLVVIAILVTLYLILFSKNEVQR